MHGTLRVLSRPPPQRMRVRAMYNLPMPQIPPIRLWIALSAIVCGLRVNADSPARAASSEAALVEAWQNTATGLFNEANQAFAALPGDEARLGEAVTLLLRQPKTDANIDRASTLLSDIVKKSPGTDLAVTAQYYLGRIEQAHRSPANPRAAGEIFRELIARHQGHPYADLATVKLAILELNEQLPEDERRARFDSFAVIAPGLKSASARRDLCITLADSAQRFGYSPEITLDLLLAADKAGLARRVEQGNAWVRIGQLAQDAGRNEIAREYYGKYLRYFIRDNRRLMVSERLAALPAPAAANAKETSK